MKFLGVLIGFFVLAASLFFPVHSIAQPIIDAEGDLGIGTLVPDPSAVMETRSTTKGFLIPRMSTLQRDVILLPAHGLLIFNATDSLFEYNIGSPQDPEWHSLVRTDSAGRLLVPLSEGSIWFGNSFNRAAELPIGVAGQVLQVDRPGTGPTWSSDLTIDALTVNGPATFNDSVIFNGFVNIGGDSVIVFSGDTVIFSDSTFVNLGDNIFIFGDTTLITNNYTEFNGDTVIFNDSTFVNLGDNILIFGDTTLITNNYTEFNGDTVIFSDSTFINLGDNIIIAGDTTLITNNYTEFNGDTVIFSDSTFINLGDNIIIAGDTTLITNNYTEFNGDTVLFSDTTLVIFGGPVNFDSTVVFSGDSVFFSDTTIVNFGGPVNFDSTVVFSGDSVLYSDTTIVNFGGPVNFDSTVVFNELPEIPLNQNALFVGSPSNLAIELPPAANSVLVTDGIAGGTPQWVPTSTIDDSDWYEVGTTDSPDDIGDTIYTMGLVGIGTATPFRQLHLTGNVELPTSTFSGAVGVVYKSGNTFIHDFNGGTFLGLGAGNLSQTTGPNTSSNIGIGNFSLANLDASEHNVAVGAGALANTTTGGRNIGVGTSALGSNVTGRGNLAIGVLSGNRIVSGSFNIGMGGQSLISNITGSSNIAMGFQSLFGFGSPNQSHSNNIAMGYRSGFRVTTGSNNFLIGTESGLGLTSGNNNIILGISAGNNVGTGSHNLLLGHRINLPVPDGSDQMSIGNLIYGTDVNGVGTAVSTGNVGIGISAPSNRLHVESSSDPLRLEGLVVDNTLDSVLVADPTGVVRKKSLGGALAVSAWVLNGNASTNSATDFLGTTDDVGLVFRTDDVERARFQSGANGGHFVPGGDDTYDLGSSTLRWQDLYLGPASLHFPTLASETGTAQDWAIGIDTSAATAKRGNLQIANDTLESINITPDGNVGIGDRFHLGGTLDLDIDTKLKVAGDFSLSRKGETGFNSFLHLYDEQFSGTAPYFFRYFLSNEADFRISHSNNHVINFRTGREIGVQPGRMNFQFVVAGPTTITPVVMTPGGLSVNYGLSLGSTAALSLSGSGTGTVGDVMVSRGSGLAPRWESPNGSLWRLDGNSGTNPDLSFVGTTDTNDLSFRTNNIIRARFQDSTGGHFVPGSDDTYGLGTALLRWRDLNVGPSSVHVISTDAETTTGRDWSLGIVETAGSSQGNFRIAESGSEAVTITPDRRMGVLASTPLHRVHAVASSTTDEFAAVYGESDQNSANQSVGVWGDASGTGATNTGTVGLLASGNGNTTAGQTNISLQVNDGEFTVGRTTETGTNYTVVEGAVGGTLYSAEGPSGVIELTLGGGNLTTAAPTAGQFQSLGTITVNNRYASAESIVTATVISKVDEGTAPDPENGLFIVDIDNRTAGSFLLRIGLIPTATNGADYQVGDTIRIGYRVINPSR